MNSIGSSNQAVNPSARILERVREDATDLALLATATTHDWKLLRDKNGTQLHEMTGESLTSKVSTVRTFGNGGGGYPSELYLVRAATIVRADVNTMLDVLRTSTSKDFRLVMKKIFGKQFESGAIVDSLSFTAPPPSYASSLINHGSNGDCQNYTEDDEYIANWITLRGFTKLGRLDGQRDFTMVCYQDVFEQNDISDKLTRKGRRIARDHPRQSVVTGSRHIGVHTFSSMNFTNIPELPRSSRTDRLHFRNSGIVVEQLAEKFAGGPMVRVSLMLSLMPSKLVLKELSQSPRLRVALALGHKVAKKYRKWLQTLALGVSHFTEAAKPAVTIQHLSTMTWTHSDHCFLCNKTFRTFRKRYHCRFCGEAVCGSCSSFVDMSSFDVNYEHSESSGSITATHGKINLKATVDGSERSENALAHSSADSTEECLEIRGCNTCASELQMNLAIRSQFQDVHNPTRYSSSNSLSQVSNACLPNRRDVDNGYNQCPGHSGVSGSPLSCSDLDNDFEQDQMATKHADGYQQYQHHSGHKISFSSITSSSFSDLSNDERAQLALIASTSSAEAVGKALVNVSIKHTPSYSLASDAMLNEFLACDSDILSSNTSTLFPGEQATRTPSMMATIDDGEYMELAYKLTCRPTAVNIRASYATTASTTAGGNRSRLNYSDMTTLNSQSSEQLLHAANARKAFRKNGQLPPNPERLRPKHEPDYKQNSDKLPPKVYHMPPTRQRRVSSQQSEILSFSSDSTQNDLIQLNASIRAPVTPSTGFVVFNDSHQAKMDYHEECDMIYLDSNGRTKK